MDKKKVTRRAAVGAAIGGLAAAPFIVRTLRDKYVVDLPPGSARKGPVVYDCTVVTRAEGVTVGPIRIPRMTIRTAEDEKRYESVMKEAITRAVDSDPRVAEAREKVFQEAWEKAQAKRIADLRARRIQELEELARKRLEEVTNSDLGNQEKKAEMERIERELTLGRESLEKHLEELKGGSRVELTEEQRLQQREDVLKAVQRDVKKSVDKQCEGKDISAEEKEQIVQERTRVATELALGHLNDRHSTQQEDN